MSRLRGACFAWPSDAVFCLSRQPRPAIQPRQIVVPLLRRLRAHDGVAEAGVLAGRGGRCARRSRGTSTAPLRCAGNAGRDRLQARLRNHRGMRPACATGTPRPPSPDRRLARKYCSIGCAASPSSATRPSTQRSVGSRSHNTHSFQFLPWRMMFCARSMDVAKTLHHLFVRHRLARDRLRRVVVIGDDEVEHLPARQRIMHDVAFRPGPQRRRVPAQIFRHLARSGSPSDRWYGRTPAAARPR